MGLIKLRFWSCKPQEEGDELVVWARKELEFQSAVHPYPLFESVFLADGQLYDSPMLAALAVSSDTTKVTRSYLQRARHEA